jgi:formylmethanofuran dehydrogenase subunit E
VATGCWVGRRTLRVEDYGKMAATVVDTQGGRAFRIRPHGEARSRAGGCDGTRDERWQAMLESYQRLPDDALLSWAPVRLRVDLDRLISSPGRRIACTRCGAEVMNGREVPSGDGSLCRACAGDAYYEV